jgi:hypothetical protein
MGSRPVGFEVSACWPVLAAGLHAPTQKDLQVWLCTGVALRECACVGQWRRMSAVVATDERHREQ